MKIEGKATYTDIKGVEHSIKGRGSLPDDISLKDLKVSGKISFGEISCDKITIDGECNGKVFSAENISIKGTAEIDSVNAKDFLQIKGKPEIKKIVAAEVMIESRGGKIGTVNCSKIKIFHGENHDCGSILSNIFGGKSFQNNSRVQIKNIDAQKVNLQNCEVEEIHCKDAVINSNCVIEKLFVEGECEIAADSKVGETIRKEEL